MLVRGLVTTIPSGDPVPNGTEGEIRTLDGNTFVATVTTTDGWFEYERNGSPGPFKITWDYSDTIKVQYSKIVGPSGATDVGNLPLLFRAFRDGVVDDLSGELAVSATGSNMQVSVALGVAIVQGIVYDHRFVQSLTISAANNTNPRIDTVVVEVVPAGAGEDVEGRSVVKVIAGTPAASPAAPTLTQNGSLWQFPLANILVGANVIVIGSDKITDRRQYTRTTIPADSITPVELNDDALALFALKESGSTKNSVPVNRLNFNGDHFDLTVNPSFDGKQIDIELASGAGTARPVFMPITEFVATGVISANGSVRTLATLGVGPLPANVPYAVMATAILTVRNQINTGTINLRCNINGGANVTREYQGVGGVPRLTEVHQSAQVTRPTASSFNVVASVEKLSGDPMDIRAGEISVIAFPASLMAGA